jgi:hypothetical protein
LSRLAGIFAVRAPNPLAVWARDVSKIYSCRFGPGLIIFERGNLR